MLNLKSFISARFVTVFCIYLISFSALANSTQEQKKLLVVKDKYVQMKLARSELKREKLLFVKGGNSKHKVESFEANAELSEIRFQQALLELLNSQPKVTIEKAIKYKDNQGQHFLDITVKNTTQVLDASQRDMLASFDNDVNIPVDLWQRNLENIFISIKEVTNSPSNAMPAGNVAIALPYESRIPTLAFNETKVLKFRLLTNTERFNIHINYRGSEQVIGVYAEQYFEGANVELVASQITKEADLGTVVEYPFTMRRNSQDTRTFQLNLYNMPSGVRYNFLEKASNTPVSQIRMSTGDSEKSLLLRLELPEKHTQGFELDVPVTFFIVAFDANNAQDIPSIKYKITAEKLETLIVAHSKLNLVARGIGKPVINAPSLIHHLEPGVEKKFTFNIKNEGSRELKNISFESERPIDWNVKIKPAYIAELPVNIEQKVTVFVTASSNSLAGDFDLRLKTEGYTATRPIAIEDKVFRLAIKPVASSAPIIIIVFIFISIIALIIFMGRKVKIR